MSNETNPKPATAAAKVLRDGRQSGRKFGTTSDGVTIYKPSRGATNFTAKELRAAVSEARGDK